MFRSSITKAAIISVLLVCCCCSGEETTEVIRCTEKELEQFSQEYEQCHSRALSQLQAERPKLESLKER